MKRSTCLYCEGPLKPGRYSHWQDCAKQCRNSARYEGGIDMTRFALVLRATPEQMAKGRPNWPYNPNE